MERLVIALVLGCIIAPLAYRESESYRRTNGVTPWHLPSALWAFLGFVSFLLCAVLLVIARRTTKPLPLATQSSAAAAGWHPDPADARQLRYWNGIEWTEHVRPRVPSDLAESSLHTD